MEIERKWWISAFPEGLPLLEEAVMEQGYISTRPVVRIRRTEKKGAASYVLCFKGKGTLAREEIETDIPRELFARLAAFIGVPLLKKEFKTYRLPSGDILECSLVQPGEPQAFYYAEVEFETVEKALAFCPPPCLGEEITENRSFSMNRIWEAHAAKFQPPNNP